MMMRSIEVEGRMAAIRQMVLATWAVGRRVSPGIMPVGRQALARQRQLVLALLLLLGTLSTGMPVSAAPVYTIIDLGTLASDNSGRSEANAINATGQVVGGAFLSRIAPQRPVLWHNGQVLDLNASTTAGGTGLALAINDGGQVVGLAQFDPNGGMSRACLWQDGVVTDLGTLGGKSSTARGVSGTGTIVGSA